MICSPQKKKITHKKNSRYVRNPKIAERSIEDTVFLINPDTDMVFFLDSLSSGIWQLLREPISIFDATNIVQKAFPDMPQKKIARDVSKFIANMSKRNLLLNNG